MPNVPTTIAVPTYAWQQEGMENEQDRRRKTRLENSRALQEISESMSRQGKQVTADEWFNIVRDTVGPQGFLYGYSPAQDVVTAMRERTNLAAQETQRRQKHEQFQREITEQKELETVVADMVRENPNIGDGEVAAKIGSIYGPERAEKFAPRINAIRGREGQKDHLEGVQLGQSFDSLEDAQKYVEANSFMSPTKKQAIISTAKQRFERLEQERDTLLWTAAQPFVNTGFDPNDPQVVNAAIARLPPSLRKTPEEAMSNAMRVLDFAGGMKKMDATSFRVDQERGLQRGALQNATAADALDIGLAEKEEQQRQLAERTANLDDSAYLLERGREKEKGIADRIAKTGKSKVPPEVQAAAGIAGAALRDFQFAPEDEYRIQEAVLEGPQAVQQAIAKGRANAVPVSADVASFRKKQALTAGVGMTGDPARNYEMVLGYDNDQLSPILKREGEYIGQAKRNNPQNPEIRVELQRKAALAGRDLVEMREIAARSGRIALTQEQQSALEQGLLYKRYAPMFESAGMSEAERRSFIAQAMQFAGSAFGIERRQSLREINAANRDRFTRNALDGAAPSALVPESPMRSNVGGSPPNQWWR